MRRWLAFPLLLAIAGGAAFWALTIPVPALPRKNYAELDRQGDAMRGEQVFNAGGCAACHSTPGQADRLKLGGGLGLPSPFGTFYVPNISPDPQDGIGAWSAGDLANAMLAGLSPSGEHYYPAFPFTTYAHAKIADIADLSAYLHSLAPVAGKVRAHGLPFPFNIRRGLGLWKRLFLDQSPVVADAARPASWNRGHYLAEALGHCAECHSPRNLAGAIVAGKRYSGGPNPEGKGMVPNITQAPDGLAKWSADDIAELLKTGFTPEYDSVGGTMAAVVRNTARLPEADRAAIAQYIKSLPAVAGMPRAAKAPKQAVSSLLDRRGHVQTVQPGADLDLAR